MNTSDENRLVFDVCRIFETVTHRKVDPAVEQQCIVEFAKELKWGVFEFRLVIEWSWSDANNRLWLEQPGKCNLRSIFNMRRKQLLVDVVADLKRILDKRKDNRSGDEKSGDHFEEQFERLRDCFGLKSYGPQRASRIKKFCKHLTVQQFERIVDTFIDTMRVAPTPSDFLREASRYGVRAIERRTVDFNLILKCGHRGSKSQYDKESGACISCLAEGYIPEIMMYPYKLQYIPGELHNIAKFFQKKPDEKGIEYVERTKNLRKEVERLYGLVSTKPSISAEKENKPIKSVIGNVLEIWNQGQFLGADAL